MRLKYVFNVFHRQITVAWFLVVSRYQTSPVVYFQTGSKIPGNCGITKLTGNRFVQIDC